MRTLLCRARCSLGGEPEVPFCCPVRTAYRQLCGATCYATGLPRVFQPCFGKFFFEAVIGLSEAAGGTLAASPHTTTRAITNLT